MICIDRAIRETQGLTIEEKAAQFFGLEKQDH